MKTAARRRGRGARPQRETEIGFLEISFLLLIYQPAPGLVSRTHV